MGFFDDLASVLPPPADSPTAADLQSSLNSALWRAFHPRATITDKYIDETNTGVSTQFPPDIAGNENSVFGLTPWGVNLENPTETETSFTSSRPIDYNQFVARLQSRDRAFQVFDINPFLLVGDQFLSQVPINLIYDKIGYDNENNTLFAQYGYNADQRWRTVQLPITGTFLRFEFKQSKINTSIASDLQNYRKPTNFSDGIVPTQIVFVQFDDPSAPLILVNDNDVFECDFSSVYVTCLLLNTEISVTIGNKAKYFSQSRQPKNSEMDVGPGHGLWEVPRRHAVPFCLSPTNLKKEFFPSAITLADGAYFDFIMFNNEVTTAFTEQNLLGVGIAWLTSFSLSATTYDGLDNQLQLYAMIGNCPSPGGATTAVRFTKIYDVVHAFGSIDTGFATAQREKNYAKPLRMICPPTPAGAAHSSAIVLRVYNQTPFAGTGSSVQLYWSATGYTYGLASLKQNSGNPANNTFVLEGQCSAPFPLDVASEKGGQNL